MVKILLLEIFGNWSDLLSKGISHEEAELKIKNQKSNIQVIERIIGNKGMEHISLIEDIS